jgi:hypothetical protein
MYLSGSVEQRLLTASEIILTSGILKCRKFNFHFRLYNLSAFAESSLDSLREHQKRFSHEMFCRTEIHYTLHSTRKVPVPIIDSADQLI